MPRLRSRLLRSAIFLHRWVGAALGILMLGWCLSGMVMMYVPYPALDEVARLAALQPLGLGQCCQLPEGFDQERFEALQIEMLGEAAVLRVRAPGERQARLIELRGGAVLESVSAGQALSVAQEFGNSRGYAGPPHPTGRLSDDQWTVEASFRASAPLLTFTWDDPRHPVLYVSERSGKAVQFTEASQRFWNYLGSVPHWIYFLPLRENPRAWSAVVIWSSLVGSLLTAFGLGIGIVQLWRMRRRGRISPYRGMNLLHHVPGLVFGVLVLTWVASGLFSMNPWGFLENDQAFDEPARLSGAPLEGTVIRAALEQLKRLAGGGTVSLQSAALDGRLYFVAADRRSIRLRLAPGGTPAPLRDSEVAFISRSLANGTTLDGPILLQAGDTYYFSHHRYQPVFPVYRFSRRDGEHTLYYVDPISGLLLRRIGSADRGYRWLHEGMHRLDFIEARPGWDLVMLLLMSGVTFVCATGLILGIRRWRRALAGA